MPTTKPKFGPAAVGPRLTRAQVEKQIASLTTQLRTCPASSRRRLYDQRDRLLEQWLEIKGR